MDVHKPKPVRNWRDFLKEVGIIVLSIVIAISLEQAVEYFHWKNEVEIGRAAIVAEMAANNRYYARRIGIAPCLDKMIGEAQGIIDSLENKSKVTPFTVFHLGQGSTLSESEWQSERASQALTHFPRAELALMSSYYAKIPMTGVWMIEETEAWSELSVLQNPPVGLSPDAIARLRVSLARAKQTAYRFLINSYQQLKISSRLGLARATPTPGRVEGFCKAKNDDQMFSDNLKAEMQP